MMTIKENELNDSKHNEQPQREQLFNSDMKLSDVDGYE